MLVGCCASASSATSTGAAATPQFARDRALVYRVFAVEKHTMRLMVCTVGLARAQVRAV